MILRLTLLTPTEKAKYIERSFHNYYSFIIFLFYLPFHSTTWITWRRKISMWSFSYILNLLICILKLTAWENTPNSSTDLCLFIRCNIFLKRRASEMKCITSLSNCGSTSFKVKWHTYYLVFTNPNKYPYRLGKYMGLFFLI